MEGGGSPHVRAEAVHMLGPLSSRPEAAGDGEKAHVSGSSASSLF